MRLLWLTRCLGRQGAARFPVFFFPGHYCLGLTAVDRLVVEIDLQKRRMCPREQNWPRGGVSKRKGMIDGIAF
jgi:hypothetical protein